MAEIEHYVDPLDKRHPRFDEVKDVKLILLPKDVQTEGRTELREMSVGDAVYKVISISPCIISKKLTQPFRKSSITRPLATFSPGLSCFC